MAARFRFTWLAAVVSGLGAAGAVVWLGVPRGQHRDAEPAGAAASMAPSTSEELQATLEASFTNEAVDETWSRSSKRKLAELLSAALPGDAKVDSIQCRSRSCRVAFVPSSIGTAQRVAAALTSHAKFPWNGAMSFATTTDAGAATATSLLFAAREGYGLPSR